MIGVMAARMLSTSSAAQIWELCDGHSTFDQIASTFAASYDVPIAVVQADVRSILAKFRELCILE